jgi:hypothetical protein
MSITALSLLGIGQPDLITGGGGGVFAASLIWAWIALWIEKIVLPNFTVISVFFIPSWARLRI